MSEQLVYTRVKKYCCVSLLKLHEWMQNRPLILSFLLSSSCILFSFLLIFCGDVIPRPFTLTMYDKDSHLRLTKFGLFISVACIVWTFIIQAAEKYYQYKNGENLTGEEAENYIRERVDTRIVNVCNNKCDTLLSVIHGIISDNKVPKYIISKPCEQLKMITREMRNCLRAVLVHGGYYLNENEMYVSIFYKFYSSVEWKQTHSAFPETGLSVLDVTSNPKSTFSQVLKNKNGVIFINDQQKGMVKEQYIPDKDDKYDENNALKGSILCYRIICQKHGIKYIEAVLSISTYDKKIEPSNSNEKIKNTQDNICKYIIQAFEKRIKIELCLVYLSELYYEHKKRAKVCTRPPKLQNNGINNIADR